MEKRWIPVASLVLNALLLVLLLFQGGRLSALEAAANEGLSRTGDLLSDVTRLRDEVDALQTQLRDGEKMIADWSLEPMGLDMEERTLLADVVLQLKEWGADSAVDLTVSTSGAETTQDLAVDETGACQGQIAIPLDGNPEMILAAQVTSGGVTAREDLGIWYDIAALLPLRQRGTSFSGPGYLGGVLTSQVDVCIETEGQARVVDPAFRIYLNGDLAEEIPAEISQGASSSAGDTYAPATPEQKLEAACMPEDTVAVAFFCRDNYGLGYEFAVAKWTVSASGVPATEPDAPEANPALTWPA